MPGPARRNRITKAGAALASTLNSTRPPPAYLNALRAISEVAVAMRVWSSWAKPSKPGDLAGPLPGQDDVVLDANFQSQEGHVHGDSPLPHPPPGPLRRRGPALISIKSPGDQTRVPVRGSPDIDRGPSASPARRNA